MLSLKRNQKFDVFVQEIFIIDLWHKLIINAFLYIHLVIARRSTVCWWKYGPGNNYQINIQHCVRLFIPQWKSHFFFHQLLHLIFLLQTSKCHLCWLDIKSKRTCILLSQGMESFKGFSKCKISLDFLDPMRLCLNNQCLLLFFLYQWLISFIKRNSILKNNFCPYKICLNLNFSCYRITIIHISIHLLWCLFTIC